MHPALRIQEILLDIFGRCHPSSGRIIYAPDLPALARTCRLFKEPALDLLWRELSDPTPLARCLPEALYHVKEMHGEVKRYSFTRPLTPAEWSILRNYAQRIRSITDTSANFDWESFNASLNPPITQSPLPNLCHLLSNGKAAEVQHIFSVPLPSLTSLTLQYLSHGLDVLQGALELLCRSSPNIQSLTMEHCYDSEPLAFSKYFSLLVSRLRNLRCVDCFGITLDVDAVSRLSRTPTLVHLSFTLSSTLLKQIISSDLPLSFPNLHVLKLNTTSLYTVSQLVSRMQLLTITEFTTFVDDYTSKQDLYTFFTSLQTSNINRTILRLCLCCSDALLHRSDPPSVLCFDDLQPCMALSSLRALEIDLEWTVELTNSEILVLASAWPGLQGLYLNSKQGWKTPSGITPNGLLQLLQSHSSLAGIAINIDTRGYTECRPFPESPQLCSPRSLALDMIDSCLEEESVPAIAALFVNIASHINLRYISPWAYSRPATEHLERWQDAILLASIVRSKRS